METRKDLSSVYKTKGGIPYHIGIRFENSTEYGNSGRYIIEDIDVGFNQIKYIRSDTNSKYSITIKEFEDNIDTHWWKISNSLLPDPSTIRFDFTNTKIRVKSEAENKWVQQAAFINGFSWHDEKYKPVTEFKFPGARVLYFSSKYMEFGDDLPDSIAFYNGVRKEEISIQNILDKQPLFKEGDTLRRKNASIWVKVTRVTNKGYHLSGTGEAEYNFNFVHTNYMKEDIKEVIGYELLKELPGVSAGTKVMFDGYGQLHFSSNISFSREELKDKNWFKPVYKTKENNITISPNQHGIRRVKVTATSLLFEYPTHGQSGNYSLSVDTFNTLRQTMFPQVLIGPFMTTVNSITIGCQVFTKEDIELVSKAIKELE